MQCLHQRGQNLQEKHRVKEPGVLMEENPRRGVHTWGEADSRRLLGLWLCNRGVWVWFASGKGAAVVGPT